MMSDNGVCKHELCNCAAQGEADYCSDRCKEAAAQDLVEIKCDCGHDGCS